MSCFLTNSVDLTDLLHEFGVSSFFWNCTAYKWPGPAVYGSMVIGLSALSHCIDRFDLARTDELWLLRWEFPQSQMSRAQYIHSATLVLKQHAYTYMSPYCL